MANGCFKQDVHKTARSKEIENIFQKNKNAILEDIENLELTLTDIATKWNVSARSMRRFMERLGIDSSERIRERRLAGFEQRGPVKLRPKQEDAVRNPELLSMKW